MFHYARLAMQHDKEASKQPNRTNFTASYTSSCFSLVRFPSQRQGRLPDLSYHYHIRKSRSITGDLKMPLTPTLDVRAQILANAMILFPHLVDTYVEKHGHTALEAGRIFDVIYCVGKPSKNARRTTDRGSKDLCACLVHRDLDFPAVCRILIQTGLQVTSKGLAERLFAITMETLGEGSDMLPTFTEGVWKESSDGQGYWQHTEELTRGAKAASRMREGQGGAASISGGARGRAKQQVRFDRDASARMATGDSSAEGDGKDVMEVEAFFGRVFPCIFG